MKPIQAWTWNLPLKARQRLEPLLELVTVLGEVKDTGTVISMLPSVGRGFVLRQGRQETPTQMVSGHVSHFDWTYRQEFPEMAELYRRAKRNQWDAEVALDWGMDVDPPNPEVPILPAHFFPLHDLPSSIRPEGPKEREFIVSIVSWLMSQFLHGEQGALMAAAQVTESVPWLDGKLYGSTQVVDEGRHVEVFHRYLDTKLNKLYTINDNLFTIIDALITDPRWDMKFLGMQIMIEGLALGAFGMLYKITQEPLLRSLLRYVIQDEARHVHYGVIALHRFYTKELTEAERREREDWAFEVALLMRNRFMAHEVYEEWFEGVLPRHRWNALVQEAPGMLEFRTVMFKRLVPNLKYIGLMSDRMKKHYEEAGLLHFATGANATELTGDQMLKDLDANAGLSES